jgi:hypothetical protein
MYILTQDSFNCPLMAEHPLLQRSWPTWVQLRGFLFSYPQKLGPPQPIYTAYFRPIQPPISPENIPKCVVYLIRLWEVASCGADPLWPPQATKGSKRLIIWRDSTFCNFPSQKLFCVLCPLFLVLTSYFAENVPQRIAFAPRLSMRFPLWMLIFHDSQLLSWKCTIWLFNIAMENHHF